MAYQKVEVEYRFRILTYVMAIALLLLAIVTTSFLYLTGQLAALNDLLLNHFPGTVGVLASAFIAFFVVAVFTWTEGEIALEVPGFKLIGASGPILLWVVCFLAIAAGARLMWPLR